MNDEQLALLQQIRTHPDDDLSRLVYADWLEERGEQPMAELIRCHIERERLDPNSAQHFGLLMHAGMLLAQHRDRWTAEWNRRFGVTGVEFARGIPEEVELPIGRFAGVADELFATFPVRHVMLTGVATLAALRRLRMPPEVLRSATIPWAINPHLTWGGQWLHSRPRCTFTVLHPAPDKLEPALGVGRWRILCPAAWSAPDLGLEEAYFTRFNQFTEEATLLGELRLATRLFNVPAEFERWCPVPNPATGPHWIDLEDGRLTSHWRSLDLPDGGEEDDELYDGDLE
jgi:uncharacterized protein (TIGR02996 family)